MRKTVIALAMCVTLAFSSLSTVCAASQWSAPASTTDEQKSYVEGEALTIVRGEVRLQGPGRTERIAQVSARAFQDVLEEWDDSEVLTKEGGSLKKTRLLPSGASATAIRRQKRFCGNCGLIRT